MRPPEPPSSLSPPPRSEMPSFPGAALSSPISPYHESPFSPISEDDAGVIDDDDFSDKMTTYMICELLFKNTREVSSCHRNYWYRADFVCPAFEDTNFGLITNLESPFSPLPPFSFLKREQEGEGRMIDRGSAN